tara:strand:+ start:412 stop:1350 length:939 start_codon:yes stop_codon:yes gene_type:complete
MNNIHQALISVVIPTFNHAEFIRKSVSSVLNQTYKNFEIIIVDNHSADHTKEVIDSFRDPRIKYHKINNNGVIASSRNKGINKSSGEWIAFLDSDDFWYRERLSIIASHIEETDSYDVITTDEKIVSYGNVQTKRVLRYGPNFKNLYKKMLLYGNRLSTSAVCVRKEFLIKNNLLFDEREEFITVEDYDLWLRISKCGAKFKFISSIQGEYSVHERNNSRQEDIHLVNNISLLKEHIFKLQEFDERKERLWKRIGCRLKFNASLIEIRSLNILSGLKSLFLTYAKSPLFLTSYIFFLFYIKTLNFVFSLFKK